MNVGRGTVKKYSREYHRTLKTGEKKKYTTQQVQITVPKTEDLYEDREEVLIIPQSEIENFKNLERELEDVKIANFLQLMDVNNVSDEYSVKIKELEAEIEKLKKEENNDFEILKDKHSKLIEENENLKNKFVNIKVENENLKTKYGSIKEENKNLKNKCSTMKDSYNSISDKYDQLKQENFNAKTSYAQIYAENEDLEKDYDSLRLEYNDLVDRYNTLEEELHNMKTVHNHDAYIANKVKEFVLNKQS